MPLTVRPFLVSRTVHSPSAPAWRVIVTCVPLDGCWESPNCTAWAGTSPATRKRPSTHGFVFMRQRLIVGHPPGPGPGPCARVVGWAQASQRPVGAVADSSHTRAGSARPISNAVPVRASDDRQGGHATAGAGHAPERLAHHDHRSAELQCPGPEGVLARRPVRAEALHPDRDVGDLAPDPAGGGEGGPVERHHPSELTHLKRHHRPCSTPRRRVSAGTGALA